MGDVVNLNRFRKTRKRAQDKARASENRVRHGRTRSEKRRDADADERRGRLLEESRLPRGDTNGGDADDPDSPAKE